MRKTGCGMVARRPGGQLRRAGWSRGRALPLGRGRRGGWRAACTWVHPGLRMPARACAGAAGDLRAGQRQGHGAVSPQGHRRRGGHDCWGGQEAGPTSHCSGLGARKRAAARASSGAAASSSAGTAASRSVTGSSSRGAAAMRPTRPPCCRPSRCLAARRTAGSTRRPGSCGPTCAGTSCCGLVPRAHGLRCCDLHLGLRV